jgi:23S rRNA G2445 N2-methylase RlmL
MCGSGTIAIEAALMARNVAPGLTRLRKTAAKAGALLPSQWPGTNLQLLRDTVLQARDAQRPASACPQLIMANDWHPGAYSLACKDAQSAGVADDITISNADVDHFRWVISHAGVCCFAWVRGPPRRAGGLRACGRLRAGAGRP